VNAEKRRGSGERRGQYFYFILYFEEAKLADLNWYQRESNLMALTYMLKIYLQIPKKIIFLEV
jgi:hypothetical protein